jgi:hypothetical protein
MVNAAAMSVRNLNRRLPVGNQDLAAGISAPGPHRGRQAAA